MNTNNYEDDFCFDRDEDNVIHESIMTETEGFCFSMINDDDNNYIQKDFGVGKGKIVAISGASNSGKSSMLLNWVGNIILNKQWIHTKHLCSGEQQRVLWIDADSFGANSIKSLLNKNLQKKHSDNDKKNSFGLECKEAWTPEEHAKVCSNLFYYQFKFIDRLKLSIKDDQGTKDTILKIKKIIDKNKITAIVFDPLSSLSDFDENSSDIGKLIHFLKTEFKNQSIFLICHTGKSDANEYRGSSAIKDAVDEFYKYESEYDFDDETTKCTLKSIKSRCGNQGFEATFHFTAFNYDQNIPEYSMITEPYIPLSFEFIPVSATIFRKKVYFDIDGNLTDDPSALSIEDQYSDLIESGKFNLKSKNVKEIYKLLVERKNDSYKLFFENKQESQNNIIDWLKTIGIGISKKSIARIL